MSQLSANATAGLHEPCPRCGAEPGESCVDRFDRTRQTTHRERKPKEMQDGS